MNCRLPMSIAIRTDPNRIMPLKSIGRVSRLNTGVCGVHDEKARWSSAMQTVVIDPTATFALHCGNGFVAGYSPYQSTRSSR
jgi:hypothetical protein